MSASALASSDTRSPHFAVEETCAGETVNGWCTLAPLSYKIQPREATGLIATTGEIPYDSIFPDGLRATDTLFGAPLTDLDSGDPVYLTWIDRDGDGRVDVDEWVYLSSDPGINGTGTVAAGDLRLTGHAAGATGSSVQASDTDFGSPLTALEGYTGGSSAGPGVIDDVLGYYDADFDGSWSDGDTLFANPSGFSESSDTLALGDVYMTGGDTGEKIRSDDPLLGATILELNDDGDRDPRWTFVDDDGDGVYDAGEPIVLDIDDTGSELAYSEDFEGVIGPEWSDDRNETASDGNQVLGVWSAPAGGGSTLTLSELPEHSTLTVEYDVYAVGDWSETYGNRHLVEVDGATAVNTTFHSDEVSGVQCAPEDCPATHVGGTGAYMFEDPSVILRSSQVAVYRMSATLNHTGSSATVEFLPVPACCGERPVGFVYGFALDDIRVLTDVSGLERGQPVCDLSGGEAVSSNCWASISTDGRHVLTASADDRAGNPGLVSLGLELDTTPPAVVTSQSCDEPGANGWCLGTATGSGNATDATSGVDTVDCALEPPTTGGTGGGGSGPSSCSTGTSLDGTYTFTFTATDLAGNSASGTESLMIDGTPPVVTINTPCEVPGDNGWCKSSISATFSASDATSGIASTTCRIDGSVVDCASEHPLPEGTTTLEIDARDNAGNTATTSTTVKLDTVAPSITFDGQTPAPNANGWNNENITLSWTCTDATSGPISNKMWLNLTQEGENQSGTAACGDLAGHSISDTQSPFNIDKTHPASTSSLAGTLGDNDWYTTPVDVTLSATDALSGVDRIEYQLDGSATQTYASTFAVADDGTHDVKFWSTDLADNQEPDPTTSFKIDTTEPVPTIDAPCSQPGSNGWCMSSVTATFSATDATSGIASMACRIDGSAVSCAGEHSLSDGTRTLEMDATDNAGNTATTSTTVKVDTAPPTVATSQSCTAPGNNGWCLETATGSGNATDSASGIDTVNCGLDPAPSSGGGGSGPSSCSAATSQDGTYTFTFTATDLAGNTASGTESLKVDGTPPDVGIGVNCPVDGANGWCQDDVQVTFGWADATSRTASVACSHDCFNGSTLTDGTHDVTIQVEDNAGNTAFANKSAKVDTTPPEVATSQSCTDPGANDWCLGSAIGNGNASDATSGIDTVDCALDPTPSNIGGVAGPTSCSRSTSQDGTYTFTFTATDLAGHMAFATESLKIDGTPPNPNIQLSCSTGDPVTACPGELNYAWSFSDATSGVASSSCLLNDAIVPCTNSTITAEGAHLLELNVTDTAGNTATASATGVIDTISPLLPGGVHCTQTGNDGWCRAPEVTYKLMPFERGGTLVYSEAFDGSIGSEWSQLRVSKSSSLEPTIVTAADGDRLLGPYGEQDGVSLTLEGLPEHETLTIEYDLHTIGGVDGNDVKFLGPDELFLEVGQALEKKSKLETPIKVIETTLSVGSTDQCYPDDCPASHPAGTGAYAYGIPGVEVDGQFGTVYRFTGTVLDSNSSITIGFTGSLSENITQESWAIDDVRVLTDVSGLARAQPTCQLDGASPSSQRCWDTVSTDGNFTVTGWALDEAGNNGAGSVSVKLDSTPPFAAILPSCDQPGNEGWCLVSSYGYDLNASDATSGVDTVACRVDNATASCSGKVTGEGAHTIEADVTDVAGHLNQTSLALGIDSQDPTVEITATCPNEGANGWCLEPVTVTTSASDDASGLADTTCLLDGSVVDCGSFDVATEGGHTAKIIATDLAGRSAEATTTFKVDATAPQVSFSLTCPEGGANDWCRESARLEIVVEDDGSGGITTTCEVDGTPIHCDELLEFTKQGSSTVTVVAEDDVGNQATDTIEARVDSHPPAANVQFTCADPGSSGWCRSSSSDYTATASDPTSGLDGSPACRVDGASAPCSGTLAAEGTHTIEIDTLDLAGNPVTFQRSLSLDSSTPTLTSLTPGQGTVALGWDAPDGPSSTSGYKVHRATAASGPFTAVMATDGSTQATDTGLSPNTTYHYQVTALGEAGESATSNTLNATTGPVAPGAPRNLTAEAAGPTEVEISWEPPATNGGDALTNYRIYRGTTSGELTLRATVPASQTSFTDSATATDDEENTGFVYFRVNATNSVGEGVGSDEVRYPPNAPEPEPQPQPEPEQTPTEFELAWLRTEGPTIDADARAITLSPDGATVFAAGTVATPDGEQIAVTAYAADDANRLWHTRLGETTLGPDRPTTLITSPAGDQVFLAGAFGDSYAVAALDTDGGAIQWTQRLAGAGHEALDLAIEDEGSLLYATGTIQDPDTGADLHTLALEASTGATAWQATYATGGQDEGGDIAYDASTGTTLVSATSAQDAVVIAYDATTGDQKWLVRHDGGDLDLATGLALTPSQGLAHLAITSLTPTGHEGRILSYDIATGQLAWTQALGSGQANLPAGALVPTTLTSDATTGTLFLASEIDDAEAGGIRRAVHALSPESGHVQWSRALDASSTGDAHVNALAVTSDGSQVVLAGATWDRAGATQLALTGLSASNGSTLWSDAQGAAGPDQAIDVIASPTGDLFTTGTLTAAGETQRSATLAYVPASPGQGGQENQASTDGSSSEELPDALVAAYERLGHEIPETPEAAMEREIRPVPGAGMTPPVCIPCTTGLDLSELSLDQPRQGPEDDVPDDVQIILNQTIPEDETVRLENGTVIVIGTIEVEGTLVIINTTLEFAPTSDGIFVKSTGLLLSQDAALQATLGLSPASRAPFQVDVEAGGILNMQHTVVFGGQGVSSRSELTTFEHNLVQNNTVGLSMEDVEGPTIQSNTFLGNDAGMRLNQTNVTVTQNVFEFGISGLEDHNSTLNVANNDFVSMTWGIIAESSEGGIDNNRFTDRHRPVGDSIGVFDSMSPIIRGNTIEAWGTGIRIENARAWVDNNTLTDNVIAGISVDSNPAPMHIRDNAITLNAGQGILLTSTADIDVSRNLVDGNSEDGIRVEQSPSATISNNTVRASGIHGISILSSPASIVQDNRLESSDAHGIVVAGDSGASRVLRNNVTGAHVKGILVRGPASELVDNRVTGALEAGIAVRGDAVRVLRGQAFDNQGHGMQVAFASGVSIEQARSNGNLGAGFALVLDEGTTIHQSEAKNNRDGATTLASTLAELTCTRLLDNAVDGVRTELGEPAVVYNAWIEGNDVFGANNPSPSTMDARHSYWGASDGPSTLDGTGGSGDLVSENVQFEPFLTSPPSCGAGVDQGEASQSAEDQGLPTVNQEPTASFSASPAQPATGQEVSFTDDSSDPDGEVVAWSWDFGDGATSTQASPTHTYQDPGTYTVELEVTDDEGATDNTTRVIEVVKALPFAAFKVHPAAPVETVQVSFTDDSEGDDAPIVSWSWDFGDGNTSTDRHPEHTYAQAGTYTIELTIEDAQGRTSTRSQPLTVEPMATTDSIGVAVSSPNVFAGKIAHDEQPILSIEVRDDQGNPVENALIQATVIHRESGLTHTTKLTPTSSAGLAQIVVPWDVSTGKQGTNLEGQHAVTVTAEARDSAGQPIETDAQFNYVVKIDR